MRGEGQPRRERRKGGNTGRRGGCRLRGSLCDDQLSSSPLVAEQTCTVRADTFSLALARSASAFVSWAYARRAERAVMVVLLSILWRAGPLPYLRLHRAPP